MCHMGFRWYERRAACSRLDGDMAAPRQPRPGSLAALRALELVQEASSVRLLNAESGW